MRVRPRRLAASCATLRDVDLSRAAPYLPAGGPVGHVAGRGAVAATLRHDRATGLRLATDGEVEDLAVGPSATAPPLLRDRRLGFRLDELALRNGSFRVGKLAVTGAPALALAGGEPERVLALQQHHVRDAGASEVVRHARAHASAADDDDVGRAHVRHGRRRTL